MAYPTTLVAAIKYFSKEQVCIDEVAAMRWPDGHKFCIGCGEVDNLIWLANQKRFKCRGCKKQFSVKVGTIFHDSPLGLDKWMVAMWLLANSRNGISSYELSRSLGITQKSAWFMLHRIREAMKENHGIHTTGGNWGNPIEIDETFIGGKPKNKHVGKRTQTEQKTIVMGMLNRETRQIRAKVIPNVKRETLQAEILANVGFNAHVYTDGWTGYIGLDEHKNFTHRTVNHINEYVNGRVHTQGIENFWSLLKRNLSGTYVAVEPFHLDAYVDEQAFRFNNRINVDDATRFNRLVDQIVGKRLTYAEL